MTGSRVLVVSSYPPRHCGIGAYAAAQVARMRADGDAVVVLSPPDGDGDLRVPFLGGAALRRAASLGDGFDRIVVHYETGIWFRPHSPVTHVLTAASLLWLTLRRARVEIVVHEARTPSSVWRPDYALLRLAFARAAVRFHSRAELAAFERAYRVRTRAAIVDHAPNVTVHATMSKAAARKRLGLDGERPLFVAAGFLQPDKSFERAIRAFGAAGSIGRLAIVGSVRDITEENVRYATDLRALAERSQNVTVLERFVADDEFDTWLTAADAFVLPYRRAWSSGALARAQRLGTPALVSNVGGLAEQAGERDRVFETDEELAELMRDAMRPPGRRRPARTREGASGSPPREHE
jgi:glycosyltransferase involved in cell wall biosynthesis